MYLLKALEQGLATHSAEAMMAIGLALGREIIADESYPRILALYGDLGAGKTTFVRGLAEALGHKEITSPSFNYFFLYRGENPLLHLDAYRLRTPEDYPSLMIDEIWTPKTVFVIEWPEKLGEYLPKSAVKLELAIKSDLSHNIKRRE